MYGVTLAFKDFSITKGILGSQWVGLKHFDKLFSNINFWPVVRNTILISLYKLLAGIPIAPGLAILLNEVRNMKFKRIVQTSVYLPYFISWVVVYGMCFSLFSIDGMVNNVIVKLGGDPVGFLTKPQYFRTMIVATSMWKEKIGRAHV
jgi:putative aldouronate transport system permease protein